MNIDDLKKVRARVVAALTKSRIREALRLMAEAVDADRRFTPLKYKLETIAQTYGFVAKFALSGTDDPSRPTMLTSIHSDILSLLARMARIINTTDSHKLYYSILRTDAHRGEMPDVTSLIANYRSLASQYAMMLFTDPDGLSEEAMKMKKDMERAEAVFFNALWTLYPLSATHSTDIAAIFADPVVGEGFKTLTASAIFLALDENFDIRRLELLLDAYATAERAVALRALVMFLMAVTMVSDKKLLAPLKPRIDALAEQQQWRTDVEMVFKQFLTSRDTDRITRKFTDEVMPAINDISKDIERVMSKADPDDPDAIENTDELAELFERSEFAEKMRQLSEIQMEGGDIMMSTFAHMKGYPFFRVISNWFIPYQPTRTEVREATRGLNRTAELLAVMPNMCDSDRYSMALSMERLPDTKRNMFVSQMNMQADHLADIQAMAEVSPTTDDARDRETVSNFTRSLFRFFKLYERHDEFTNPFDTPLNIVGVSVLQSSFETTGMLREASSFYYSHGYYSDALPLFQQLEADVAPDDAAMLYYCMADCHDHLGDASQAIAAFERSELFDTSNRDTLLHLALLYRTTGNHKKSVDYLRRVIASYDSVPRKLRLMLARELTETGNYTEAAEMMYALDFERPLNDKMLRYLAECEYRRGNNQKAADTLLRLREQSPADFLLRYAMDMKSGEYENGVSMLALAIPASTAVARRDVDSRIEALNAELVSAGVPLEIINIVVDEAYNRIKS